MMGDMNATQWVNHIASKVIEEATEGQPEEHKPGYMLLVRYTGRQDLQIMHTNANGVWRQCVAYEGNQHLLTEMGDRLIDDNLIDSYQLIKTVANPMIAI